MPIDPTDPLSSPQLAVRVEAVRQLGASGEVSALDTLLTLALEDRSSGVRLAAASAAADILARHRLDPRRQDLPEAARRALFQRLRGIDPGRNTGLFQVLACLGLPEVLVPITKGVRDPRVDVRTGALVGLVRLCSSGGANGDPHIERTIEDLLGETRLRPDVSVELARLAQRSGALRLRPAVSRLAARIGERWRSSVEEVLAALSCELTAGSLCGCWASVGLDCGEQRARLDPVTWLVLVPGTLALVGPGACGLYPWVLDAAGFCCAGLGGARPAPVRRLSAWMAGREGVDVLQIAERSWMVVPERDLPDLCDALAAELPDCGEREALCSALLDHLAAGLSDRAPGACTRAILTLLAGRPDEAAPLLEQVCAAPRARAEAWWYLAGARRALGHEEAARGAVQSYLAQAARKSRFREAAQAQEDHREG